MYCMHSLTIARLAGFSETLQLLSGHYAFFVASSTRVNSAVGEDLCTKMFQKWLWGLE